MPTSLVRPDLAVKGGIQGHRPPVSCALACRASRSGSRWNDAAIYAAIARTLNLSKDQRQTVFAARRYLQDKLTKYGPPKTCIFQALHLQKTQSLGASALEVRSAREKCVRV